MRESLLCSETLLPIEKMEERRFAIVAAGLCKRVQTFSGGIGRPAIEGLEGASIMPTAAFGRQ